MKNKQRQKEIKGEIKRRKKCRINVGKKKKRKSVSAFIAKSGPAHTVGSIGSGPDQLFRFFFFFFFFLSFEDNGFARGLKLNEIEHSKLDESKARSPRETFFVSRFSPAFPHARGRHPSLRYNFSRHLLSIFHVIYILSTYTKRIPDPNIFLRMLLYGRGVTPKLLA